MSIAQQLNSPDYRLEGFRFYADIAQPKHYEMHEHLDVEIAFMLNQASAQVHWQNDGHKHQRSLNADRLCVIPSGQPHSVEWQQNAEYIIIFIHPTLLFKTAQECVMNESVNIMGRYGVRDPLIQSIATILRSCFHTEGSVEHLYIDILINTLILYLLKNYAGCKFIETSSQAVTSQRWLKEVLEFIHESLDQDLRLNRLANVAKMSESSFCHLFKEHMDISPHQYVISKRIHRAKQLLEGRDLPISEVALACGFNSQSHLTSYFRRHTGVTPKAYQKMS